MVAIRLVCEPVAFFVGVLWRASSTRKTEPQLFQYWKRARFNRIAGVGKRNRLRDAIGRTLRVDRLDLFPEPRKAGFGYTFVISRVIADLEAIAMKIANLLPGEVILFVRRKR